MNEEKTYTAEECTAEECKDVAIEIANILNGKPRRMALGGILTILSTMIMEGVHNYNGTSKEYKSSCKELLSQLVDDATKGI